MEGWSSEQVYDGDMKELRSLLRRGVLDTTPVYTKPSAKAIDAQMARRSKNGAVKPRLVGRDLRRSTPAGGEFFAATPSRWAVKALLKKVP